MLNKLNALWLFLPKLHMPINTSSDNKVCFRYGYMCNYISFYSSIWFLNLIMTQYYNRSNSRIVDIQDTYACNSFHTYLQMVDAQCIVAQTLELIKSKNNTHQQIQLVESRSSPFCFFGLGGPTTLGPGAVLGPPSSPSGASSCSVVSLLLILPLLRASLRLAW